MRAISADPAQAWAIVEGFKPIDNRAWNGPPQHRGPLLIHATRECEMSHYEWVRRILGAQLPPRRELPAGSLVGLVQVVDVVFTTEELHRLPLGERPDRCALCGEQAERRGPKAWRWASRPCPMADPFSAGESFGLLLAPVVHRYEEPIPLRGSLGLFEVADKVTRGARLLPALRAALPGGQPLRGCLHGAPSKGCPCGWCCTFVREKGTR